MEVEAFDCACSFQTGSQAERADRFRLERYPGVGISGNASMGGMMKSYLKLYTSQRSEDLSNRLFLPVKARKPLDFRACRHCLQAIVRKFRVTPWQRQRP